MDTDELLLLAAMRELAGPRVNGYLKCVRPLRTVLSQTNRLTKQAEFALCNGGREEPVVEELYRSLRKMITAGLVEGRGHLGLDDYAGPRYTECRISSLGTKFLESTRKGE